MLRNKTFSWHVHQKISYKKSFIAAYMPLLCRCIADSGGMM